MSEKNDVPVKMSDDILRGVYANQMVVRHTREEFVLDFLNLFPPTAVVTSRVVVSPAHLKRILSALQDNLRRYEAQFGPIPDLAAPAPPDGYTN
jgi:hypothetical protein